MAGMTLGSWAIVWAVRRVLIARGINVVQPPNRSFSVAVPLGAIGGLIFAGVVIIRRFTQMFIAPENISQTYDNVYHLSAVRAILETGNGSALSIGSVVQNGPSGVYPFAWHNVVALVVEITSVPIPVAVNAVNIVIAAFVATISGMYLASRVAGTRPAVLLMSGILAGAFGAFPYTSVGWGVLYPNFLAMALLPVFIGLVADILKISVSPRPTLLLGVVVLVLALPGLMLAHPNMVMALGAFTVPLLIFWLFRRWRARRDGKLSQGLLNLAGLGVVVYLVVFVLAWDRIRPSVAGSHWPPTQTIPVALREALATSPLDVPLSWPILILTILGIAAVCMDWRRLWILGAYAVNVVFFVVVTSFPAEALRYSITGVFFNDSNRLAALLPAIALPLTVTGAVWAYDLALANGPATILAVRPYYVGVLGAGVVVALLTGVLAQNNAVETAQEQTSDYYASTPESWLLSSDEAALIARAPSTIPEDATVIGHPATGASLVYALEGRKTIMPAISSLQSADVKTIFAHLPELADNPAVCQAIQALDAYFVLDFGSGRQVSDMRMTMPSSPDLAATPGLTAIDQEVSGRALSHRCVPVDIQWIF
ncbi:DUF6541 family protein [Arthrobacter psychrolactophilus]